MCPQGTVATAHNEHPNTVNEFAMDQDPRPPHTSKSLEDVVLKFIEKNNRAIWAVIFAVALAVMVGMNAH